MNLKDLKVVFAGCAKNCEKFLPTVLENINIYSSLFYETYTVIVENGSADKTKEILKKNKNQRNIFLFRDDLNKFSYRCERLENARNLIIKTIKKDPKLADCDLLIMLDLDDIGAYKIDDKDILDSINFLFSIEKSAGVFANQQGTYYDLWALRDQKYCKNDFWVEVLQFLFKNKKLNEEISKNNIEDVKRDLIDKKNFSFEKNHPPIPVNSAFGGFGIYKMKYVLKNKRNYAGTQKIDIISKDDKKFTVKYQKCEHVNFNLGFIDQNLKLYILPNLINRNYIRNNFSPVVALKLIIKH
tara:strand:- start:1172 stop:2068 length:897 start_codon:yes stop_codon:yes gene_type:complete